MARITFAASRRSPACSGRSSDSLLKPRLNSRSASDWMSRIVIVFASAMTDASPSVVVRAAVGVASADGGPPRGVRRQGPYSVFPFGSGGFDGSENANATGVDALGDPDNLCWLDPSG